MPAQQILLPLLRTYVIAMWIELLTLVFCQLLRDALSASSYLVGVDADDPGRSTAIATALRILFHPLPHLSPSHFSSPMRKVTPHPMPFTSNSYWHYICWHTCATPSSRRVSVQKEIRTDTVTIAPIRIIAPAKVRSFYDCEWDSSRHSCVNPIRTWTRKKFVPS